MKLYDEGSRNVIIEFLYMVVCSTILFNLSIGAQTKQNTEFKNENSTSSAVGIPDAYYTFEGINLALEAPGLIENDYHVEGESFVVTSFSQPSNGIVTRIIATGAFTYEPNEGFTGVDTFTYRLKDLNNGISAYVNVIIHVLPYLNYNPIAMPDFYAVFRDSTLSASLGLFNNDFDLDGDSFVINSLNLPGNGSLNFNPTTGSFSYTPGIGFIGTDSLTYQIMDERGNLSEFTKAIIKILEPGGNIPFAIQDNFAAFMNKTILVTSPGLLINDFDPNDQTITASNFISPANGTITAFNSDGSFSYKPNENFTGIDSFAYRIQNEENNLSEFVKVTINVVNLNRPPYPIPDFYGVPKNEILTVETPGLLKNDIDPENDDYILSTFTEPLNGKFMSTIADGQFKYQPDLGFVGKDEFTYSIRDALGNRSEFVTVSIFVGKGTQPQTLRFVDPANVNSVDGMNLCSDPDIPCKTISQAISVADDGDTLEVASSIYTESLTFDKTLTLHGAGRDTISGTIIQAHADSGMANSRVIFVTEGNEVSISDLIIRHGYVSGGGESGRGGGIRVLESKLNLTNVTIEKNRAIYGGGIHNSDAYGIYTNVTFRNNYAERGSSDNQGTGGGIYNFRSSPMINEADFINNKADQYGGGVQNTDNSSPELVNANFISNSAKFGGGIFNSNESSPNLTRVEFIENNADSMGGGMYNSNSSPRLEDVVFDSNSAKSYGGGLLNTSGSNPKFFDVTFNKNFANLAGGGMHNKSNSSPFITKVSFTENEAGLGGGISNSESSPTLTNVILSNNTAAAGGGIYNAASTSKLTNAVIYFNKAERGAGILNEDTSTVVLRNVTLSGNAANSNGGGIFNFDMSTSILTNSILWGNIAEESGNELYNDITSISSLLYSIFTDKVGDIVEGNNFEIENSVTEDPLFIDFPNGNLHLQALSPAIDAGDPDADLTDYAISDDNDSIDLDLNPRIFNERIDIGAYEFQGVTTSIKPPSIPSKYILYQNYPNPFNQITNFELRIADFGFVTLKIFDILGKEVTTLVNEEMYPGNYEIKFNAAGLVSGVYLYRLQAGSFIATKKMFLLQ